MLEDHGIRQAAPSQNSSWDKYILILLTTVQLFKCFWGSETTWTGIASFELYSSKLRGLQKSLRISLSPLRVLPCRLLLGTSGILMQVTKKEPTERLAIFCGTAINQDGRSAAAGGGGGDGPHTYPNGGSRADFAISNFSRLSICSDVCMLYVYTYLYIYIYVCVCMCLHICLYLHVLLRDVASKPIEACFFGNGSCSALA